MFDGSIVIVILFIVVGICDIVRSVLQHKREVLQKHLDQNLLLQRESHHQIAKFSDVQSNAPPAAG